MGRGLEVRGIIWLHFLLHLNKHSRIFVEWWVTENIEGSLQEGDCGNSRTSELLKRVLCAGLYILHVPWLHTLNIGMGGVKRHFDPSPGHLVPGALREIKSGSRTHYFMQQMYFLCPWIYWVLLWARHESKLSRSLENRSKDHALGCKRKREVEASSKSPLLETGV